MGNCNDFIIGFDLYNNIDSLANKGEEPKIKDLVGQLSTFFLSDKLIPFLSVEGFPIQFHGLINFIERKEKFLSLKIIFPLAEELVNLKFGDILIEKYQKKNVKRKLKILRG